MVPCSNSCTAVLTGLSGLAMLGGGATGMEVLPMFTRGEAEVAASSLPEGDNEHSEVIGVSGGSFEGACTRFPGGWFVSRWSWGLWG